MNNNFRQGIISYPNVGGDQLFLQRTPTGVSLNVGTSKVEYTIAHGSSDYLLTETANITNAWTNIAYGITYWLYWDINPKTGIRTFGSTRVEPVAQPTEPAHVNQLMWYDTTKFKHYERRNGVWVEVIRVFAGSVFDNTFIPMGWPGTEPYKGTQIGATGYVNAKLGRILYDDSNYPIRKSNGEFFTTVTQAFVDSPAVIPVRIESTMLDALAEANLGKYQVVKYSDFGEVVPANYNDTNQTMIAITLESAIANSVVPLIASGVITNELWNWPSVGAPLWIEDGGNLTTINPHELDPINYNKNRPPIARVLSQTQIFFNLGIGTDGNRGLPGAGGTTIPDASNADKGITFLSVLPVDPTVPIAVGINDPIITGPRVPLPHTHDGTQVIPLPVGLITGNNLQEMLDTINTLISATGASIVDMYFEQATNTLTIETTSAIQPIFTADLSPLDSKITNVTFNSATGDLVINTTDPSDPIFTTSLKYLDTKITNIVYDEVEQELVITSNDVDVPVRNVDMSALATGITNITYDNVTNILTIETVSTIIPDHSVNLSDLNTRITSVTTNNTTHSLVIDTEDSLHPQFTTPLPPVAKLDSTTVALTGNGTVASPLQSQLIIDSDAANMLGIGSTGTIVKLFTNDTSTVQWSGAGNSTSPLSAEVIAGSAVIAAIGNAPITVTGTGPLTDPIIVSLSISSTPGLLTTSGGLAAILTTSNNTGITMVGNGTTATPLTATINLSSSADQALLLRTDATPGLFSHVTSMNWDDDTSTIEYVNNRGELTTITFSQFTTDTYLDSASYNDITGNLELTLNDPLKPIITADMSALAGITTNDSLSIDFSGGTGITPLSATVKIDSAVGNKLGLGTDGLLVQSDLPPPAPDSYLETSSAGAVNWTSKYINVVEVDDDLIIDETYHNALLLCDALTDITLTVSPDIPQGFRLDIINDSSNLVTIVGDTGVTISSKGGLTDVGTDIGGATLISVDIDNFRLIGDLE